MNYEIGDKVYVLDKKWDNEGYVKCVVTERIIERAQINMDAPGKSEIRYYLKGSNTNWGCLETSFYKTKEAANVACKEEHAKELEMARDAIKNNIPYVKQQLKDMNKRLAQYENELIELGTLTLTAT